MPAPYPTGETVDFLDDVSLPIEAVAVGKFISSTSDISGNPVILEVITAHASQSVTFADGSLTVYPLSLRERGDTVVQPPATPASHTGDDLGDVVYGVAQFYLVTQAPDIITIPSPSAGSPPAAPGQVTIPSPSNGSPPAAPSEIDIPSPSTGDAPDAPGIINIPSH